MIFSPLMMEIMGISYVEIVTIYLYLQEFQYGKETVQTTTNIQKVSVKYLIKK